MSNVGQKEAKIITVFNQKGGVGKTHTTCHLAGTFGHRGYDVLVADLDPQQTASTWVGKHKGVNFPGQVWQGFPYQEHVSKHLQTLSGKYDLIFVDCAPSLGQPGTWASLLVSDLGIIPTKLGSTDLDALPASMKLATTALEEARRSFPMRILTVAYQKGKADHRSALQELMKGDSRFPDVKLFDTTIGDRVAYQRAMGYGSTAHSLPNSADAAKELESLADEVCKLLNIPLRKKGA